MKLQKITEKFKNEANQDKVSASYLFYGDKRVDLLSYALMFSKMIMTKNIQTDAEKEKIERLIDISQHPDIEIINKNNENIKIDEVREIIYSSIESSFNSPKKIFILCGIENLRKESSNALLKILEEPPKNVYFILLSRTLNIIPTIKSRTIKFHLSGMNNEELGVSKEIYYFFDGNENDILEFKRQKLSLDDIQFQINTVEDILQIVTEMKNYVSEEFAVKNSLDLTIKYNKSIELIARRIRFWELENVYFFINEIENELNLSDNGNKIKNKIKLNKTKKRELLSFDYKGFQIFVGRNNKENEEISFSKGQPNDIWMHIKDIPGSHVLILRNNQELPEDALIYAANLACEYSKAKKGDKVTVDYCERKFVKKIKNSKPGNVTYTNFHSLLVNVTEKSL